ncbi:MAG: cyanophycin synthetase, partial [Anaerolineaceae bacterium]
CLDLDPGYLIGGIAANMGTNSHYGTSQYFVIEADEYDRMFHGLHPQVMVITNVDHDHPDMFPQPDDYYEAFNQFIERLQPNGRLLVGESAAAKLTAFQQHTGRKYTYGLAENNHYGLRNMSLQPDGCFRLTLVKRLRTQSISCLNGNLNIPGEHNALNALAALAVVDLMGYPTQQAIKCLEDFTGVQRRFEKLGTVNGILFIDDYAHHPAKIRSTLQAARANFPGRRIVAVWQPHTYSRTQTFFEDFAASFENADHLVVTEVYAAREKPDGFSAAQFVERLPQGKAVFCGDFQPAEDHLFSRLQPGDVLIMLSAGDANQILPRLMARLRARESTGGQDSAGVTRQVAR